MPFPFQNLFPNPLNGRHAPDSTDGDDPQTSVEPLTEFLGMLRASGAKAGDGEGQYAATREPLSVPMPGWWFEETPAPAPQRPRTVERPPPVVEEPYRPMKRPPIPLLTILDDGTEMTGETIRLREPVCLIGRSEGLIRIPHDPSMSARHAELVRSGDKPPHSWFLRDVGSKNGTFVCCKVAPLRPDRIVILGSRRFRLHMPHGGPPSSGGTAPGARMGRVSAWPMLVETTTPSNPLCFRLVGSCLSVGRPGFGNQIEIDDPHLARVHAEITQTSEGTWWIRSTPSLNGLWMQVRSVELTDSCRFQCGEQRFLFVKP